MSQKLTTKEKMAIHIMLFLLQVIRPVMWEHELSEFITNIKQLVKEDK